MKAKFSYAMPAALVLAAITLTACVTDPAAQTRHRQHHPDAAVTQGKMGMGAGPMGKGMMMSDAEMKSICDMHEKMMGAKTPEERRSLMTEHMKTMSPETMKKHMEMMQSEMQMMQEHMRTQTPGK